MRHLRLSYVILGVCVALLVYGLVQGTSRTSALFVGERQATGQVDANAVFPSTSTPTSPASPTRPPATQVGGATEDPDATAKPATEEPEQTLPPGTPGPEASTTEMAVTATKVPGTAVPATTTPEECDGLAALEVEADYEGEGPFEITVYVTNSGGGPATGVVLGFGILDGWEFADEGEFGNEQVWWPHGLEDAGVLYDAGDVGVGDTVIVTLTLGAYAEMGDGDEIVLSVSIAEADCEDGETASVELSLMAGDDGTSTPEETPDVAETGTPSIDATPEVTLTPEGEETPDVTQTVEVDETPVVTVTPAVEETPGVTQTAPPSTTHTAVPTASSTPVPTSTSTATPDDPGGGGGR